MQPYDVFISSNKSDYQFAWQVCDYLDKRGLSVFFCEKSLPQVGRSDYRKQIFRAIEEANHMVVVASSRSNAESDWVQDEWGTFNNEKRSRRKDGNLVTVLAGVMTIDQLPIELRQHEVFTLDASGLEKLLLYLRVDKDTAQEKTVNTSINDFQRTIKYPTSQRNTTQPKYQFKRHWVTISISILVVIAGFIILSQRSHLFPKETISPTTGKSIKNQDPQISAPSSDKSISTGNISKSTTKKPPEAQKNIKRNEDGQPNIIKEVEQINRIADIQTAKSGNGSKQTDTTNTTTEVPHNEDGPKVKDKGALINTDSSLGTIKTTSDVNAVQSTLSQKAPPIIQEQAKDTTTEINGAAFYINGPENDDANLNKVANQVRQELNAVGRKSSSLTETRYSVRWSDARIGKDGPDNKGEYVFFMKLKFEIVDANTGKTVRSFSEEEAINGRDQHATRIIDTLAQTVAHRIAQRLIKM